MKNKFQNALLVFSTIILFGCGSTMETRSMKPVLRAATDAPENFVAPEAATSGSNSCNNRLTDLGMARRLLCSLLFLEELGIIRYPKVSMGFKKGNF